MPKLERPETELQKIKSIIADLRELIRTNNVLLPEDKDLLLNSISTFLKNQYGDEDIESKLKITRIESVANTGEGLHNLDTITVLLEKLHTQINSDVYQSVGITGVDKELSGEGDPRKNLKTFFMKNICSFLEERSTK
jgi:hypothetical protein